MLDGPHSGVKGLRCKSGKGPKILSGDPTCSRPPPLVLSRRWRHRNYRGQISYSTLQSVDRKFPTAQGLHPICITCRNFQYLRLFIANERDATDVFLSLQKLMNISSIEQLYAFSYKPSKPYPSDATWLAFDPVKEFARLGVETLTDQWRFTTVNETYEFSPTYPRCLVVPAKISDNVLRYTAKFRSKGRIPALSYLHRPNMASITRSSQPLVGLKQNRSIQDEKLVEAIFSSNTKAPSTTSFNLIIDARPTANAMAQTALGAGTENVENYRGCKISFLGIDNIHVVRDSMNKLMEAMNSVESGPVPKSLLNKSGWLKHIRHILDGTATIVKQVHLQNSHVLVHCSDGWDRTAQLCSLAELCLDPYYRTIEGFAVLIEKEWVSFGHKFRDRCGHLSRDNSLTPDRSSVGAQLQAARRNVSNSITSVAKSFLGKNIGGLSFGGGNANAPSLAPSTVPLGSSPFGSTSIPGSPKPSARAPTGPHGTGGSSITTNQPEPLASVEISTPNSLAPREISPVFSQFLDCVYQLWTQFPTHFEFSERLLSALHLHVYACQFGNFLFNCEREYMHYRVPGTAGGIMDATHSVWDYVRYAGAEEFKNPVYIPPETRTSSNGSDVGAGTGPAGTHPGAHGTVSPDGRILYPTTMNLKYWAGMCLREEEIEMDKDPQEATVGDTSLVDDVDDDDGGEEAEEGEDDASFVPLGVPTWSSKKEPSRSSSPLPSSPRAAFAQPRGASPIPPPQQHHQPLASTSPPQRPRPTPVKAPSYSNPWESTFVTGSDSEPLPRHPPPPTPPSFPTADTETPSIISLSTTTSSLTMEPIDDDEDSAVNLLPQPRTLQQYPPLPSSPPARVSIAGRDKSGDKPFWTCLFHTRNIRHTCILVANKKEKDPGRCGHGVLTLRTDPHQLLFLF
ncbi:protein-tyrosine phosphatase-like protein [Powellomyces hirtus]|nr:protein-tyrosine phosphatase-like protein [Powellomyces hirtus]